MFNIDEFMDIVKKSGVISVSIDDEDYKDFIVEGSFVYFNVNYLLLSMVDKRDKIIVARINKNGDIKLITKGKIYDEIMEILKDEIINYLNNIQ